MMNIVKLISEHYPNIKFIRDKKGQTSLMRAVIHDSIGMTEAFLSLGVDIEVFLKIKLGLSKLYLIELIKFFHKIKIYT